MLLDLAAFMCCHGYFCWKCGRTKKPSELALIATEVYMLGGWSDSAQCSLSALALVTGKVRRWPSWKKARIGMSVHFFPVEIGHRNLKLSCRSHSPRLTTESPPFLVCGTVPGHGLGSLSHAHTLL